MITVMEITVVGEGEDELVLVSLLLLCSMSSLTERPHRGAPVGLEALDEADAVLLGRGFHGADVERFVVDRDILEVFEVLLLVLDLEVAGVFCLSRRHVDTGMLRLIVGRLGREPSKKRSSREGKAAARSYMQAADRETSLDTRQCANGNHVLQLACLLTRSGQTLLTEPVQ
jgi:hypothetical protein